MTLPPTFTPVLPTFETARTPKRCSPVYFPETPLPSNELTGEELTKLREQMLVQKQFALPPAAELPPPPEPTATPPPTAKPVRQIWQPRRVKDRKYGESPRTTAYDESAYEA